MLDGTVLTLDPVEATTNFHSASVSWEIILRLYFLAGLWMRHREIETVPKIKNV